MKLEHQTSFTKQQLIQGAVLILLWKGYQGKVWCAWPLPTCVS
jgi:hypothetical protein